MRLPSPYQRVTPLVLHASEAYGDLGRVRRNGHGNSFGYGLPDRTQAPFAKAVTFTKVQVGIQLSSHSYWLP